MRNYSNIVILTGAGISAESGIRTFRAADGLWEDHRIEEVATPEAFELDPTLVQRFYNMRRQPLLNKDVAPNQAHFALAELAKHFSGNLTLITQNIDDLHEQAGSEHVIHMHGEILKMRCRQTGQVFVCERALNVEDKCDCCGQSGNLRPHIVWFGEMPLFMDEIYQALQRCDLFVAIGTSGNVYPAAGFVQLAKQAGSDSLEINLEQSNIASEFDKAIYAKATQAVPDWVTSILKKA
jgi:NAD-dependent deacetylase